MSDIPPPLSMIPPVPANPTQNYAMTTPEMHMHATTTVLGSLILEFNKCCCYCSHVFSVIEDMHFFFITHESML